MADIKTAFRTKSISLDNIVAIFQGNLDPRTNDQGNITQVPQGSLYIRSNGELYQKTGTANLAFSLITATGSAVTILDTDLSNTLTLLEGSNLTSDRTLTLTTGDASRVLTINGNATLNDWFDQNVKTTGTPTFAQMFSTGNVGIGTTSPVKTLEVRGITRTRGTGSSSGILEIQPGAGGRQWNLEAIVNNSSFRIYDSSGGVERLRIIASGNVGIGTTLPLSKLHIEDATQDCSLRILTGSTFKSKVLFAVGASTPGRIEYDHATNSMAIFTASAEQMRIDSSGNVGIGTTTPVGKLHVKTDTTDTESNGIVVTSDIRTTTDSSLLLRASVFVANSTVSAGVTQSGDLQGIDITAQPSVTSAGTLSTIYGVRSVTGIGTAVAGSIVTNCYGLYSQIKSSATGTTITNAYGVYITNSETIGTITNRFDLYASSANAKNYFAGSVGIGTANPTVALDVVGDIKATGTITGTLSFTRFHVQTSGASATPTGDIVAKFEKSATTESAAITILSSTAGLSSLNMGDTVSEVVGNIAYSNASNYMTFTTNSSEAMRIDSSGFVGIGTTSPTTKFHVVGSGSASTLTNTLVAFESNSASPVKVQIASELNQNSILAIGSQTFLNATELVYESSTNNFKINMFGTTALTIGGPLNGEYRTAINGVLGGGLLTVHSPSISTLPAIEINQHVATVPLCKYVGVSGLNAGDTILTGKTSHGGTKSFLKIDINGTNYYLQASTTPA